MSKARYLYIHETTHLSTGSLEQFEQEFSRQYQPLMEQQGARLFGHWRGNPFNSRWPEITTIWEIDGMDHFGSLNEARFTRGETTERYAQWDNFLQQTGCSGEGRLCYGNDDIKSVAELKAENFNASAVLQEIMTTKPGQQREYLEQLKRLYVPWTEAMGNKWLGSFVSVTRNEEVIHYWAMQKGWSGFGKGSLTSSPEDKATLRTWMAVAPALRESWDDSLLAALPPHPLQGK